MSASIGDRPYPHGMVQFQQDRAVELRIFRNVGAPINFAPATGGVPKLRRARTLAQADALTIRQYGK